MATEEDDIWVFDSLVTFLNGPVWNAPLQSFIEERSLIFEPQDTDNEEYRNIFDDFKNLVDFMLGNFMEDIGITPQQFEKACFKGAKEGVPLQFDQNTFEQIWAANDFEMFRRMMTQRNVELQLQALELIERKFGRTPESFIPHKTEKKENAESQGKTTAQISPMMKSVELEKEVLDEVSRQFPMEETNSEDTKDQSEDLKYLDETKQNLEETLKIAIEEKLSSQKKFLEKEEPQATTAKATRIPIDRPQDKNVDSVELRKRQDYLRAQRDKLVAMKKEVRKKHLDDSADEKGASVSKIRPKSSKAAQSILQSGNLPSTADAQNMTLRKALAERLKSEVVHNNLE